MIESVEVHLIQNQCQILVLLCFFSLYTTIFLYFASPFSSLLFIFKRKDNGRGNFALFNTFVAAYKIQPNWHQGKYHINPLSHTSKPHQTKMLISTNYSQSTNKSLQSLLKGIRHVFGQGLYCRFASVNIVKA